MELQCRRLAAHLCKRSIHLRSLEQLLENVNHLNRKDEILRWIEANNPQAFVILDDDKSLNDLPSDIKEKLVMTDFLVGLNENKAIMAIEILSTHTKRY